MAVSELESRIQQLEDIENIKRLKVLYCTYCDDDYNPDGIANLFTADGVWEGDVLRTGSRSIYKGREAIWTFFSAEQNIVSFAVHNVSNPLVTVRGINAHAVWNLYQPYSIDGKMLAAYGMYRDDYIKVDGTWFYKHLRINFNYQISLPLS